MRVVVSTESRLVRTPDGRVWTMYVPGYGFWQRYLSAFDEVRVMARVATQDSVPEGMVRVDGPQVDVHALPHYLGSRQYLRQRRRIGHAVAAAAGPSDAVIVRAPSAFGSLLARDRRRQGLPYALEVIGDPYDVLGPGVLSHPLRPLLRQKFSTQLRRDCRSAAAVSYVTEQHLQSRYPAAPDAVTAAISTIDLPPTAFVAAPRPVARCRTAEAQLVSVGTLDQLYKGIDCLILAVARLAASGVRVRLTHLGGGRYQPDLERLAAAHGVTEQVTFAGWVAPGEPLHARLDEADVIVMPSRTEGLPKALIEGMARALPALGTRVGGIPELLPPDDLVEPNSPDALAEAVRRMIGDPERMASASGRNLDRARRYSRDVLTPRRADFYRSVREATESAIRGMTRPAPAGPQPARRR
ncbi:glycosyltransferase family 4 protein [Micromonospora tulbaghiae]|uniref:glycosyltransferase family 4 protein n=1 Tax=Micromonospora tulbaghiae TaxID=479978 RepID=UPI003710A57C